MVYQLQEVDMMCSVIDGRLCNKAAPRQTAAEKGLYFRHETSN
jgi:hypothetical protein